ncbi:MAG: VOC family protein [Planctomycetota bacterium]
MKIGHIELFVADPRASRSFYEEVLGFEVVAEQPGGFVWLALSGVEILLRPGGGPPRGDEYQEAANALVLYTQDLGKAVERLTARGLEFRGHDGSDRCLTFTDPDGNWFQLVNPDET